MAKTSSRIKKLRGKHSLRAWHLGAIEHLSERSAKAALKAASEAIEVSFKEGHSYVGIPYLSGTKGVDYPLTISLTIGVGEKEEEDPVYTFDLREVVEEHMAFAKDGLLSVADATRARKLALALKALAADIDDLAALIDEHRDKEDEIDLALRVFGV